jgi:hypothetical protein
MGWIGQVTCTNVAKLWRRLPTLSILVCAGLVPNDLAASLLDVVAGFRPGHRLDPDLGIWPGHSRALSVGVGQRWSSVDGLKTA